MLIYSRTRAHDGDPERFPIEIRREVYAINISLCWWFFMHRWLFVMLSITVDFLIGSDIGNGLGRRLFDCIMDYAIMIQLWECSRRSESIAWIKEEKLRAERLVGKFMRNAFRFFEKGSLLPESDLHPLIEVFFCKTHQKSDFSRESLKIWNKNLKKFNFFIVDLLHNHRLPSSLKVISIDIPTIT